MDIIHLLPDSVANQIAAGEVVQRPSSVVKELLENSIDAHATQIQIVLREAGRELIQVIDNGIGMSPADARMAFEKHATSKIERAADLFDLHTMGFRGEALASVAAVAEVELRTRRREDEAGVLIALAGSQLQRQEPCACPAGANFQVRNLFFNVPARRKFLKSNQTELSNIMQEIQHVALAHPQVEMTVTHNDVVLLQLTAGSHKQRIVQLFSKGLSQQLLPIQVENDLLNISGFAGAPEGARKKGALQFFFVNGRFMKHPYFHKAVLECYQDLIPEGTQPNYFIYLLVDPQSIDVNIHPTKTEIKFENEAARWHILMATIREALGKYNAVPTIDFDQSDAPEVEPQYLPNNKPNNEPRPHFEDYNPFRQQPAAHWETLYEDFRKEDRQVTPATENIDDLPSRMDEGMELPSAMDLMNDLSDDEKPQSTRRVQYLQVGNRYIVGNARGGMMLIDQHRAHLCILYDRYHHQICNRQGLTQHELFPEMIEVSPADEPHLQAILPELSYLGFELDNLGGGTYAVNGKPASLESSVNIHELMLQMIDAAREEVHGVGEELDRRLALRLAKAQAIPYGRQIGEEEMQQLVESLLALPDHQMTPDGHPVMTLVPNDVLASQL
ncbi:MAG: DNA mismatch repair endonuclease MutL [Bacteroidales bacterium]|nr:DNA mismatch repair endonuclease MutL [Bacteroidales bacterium]